MSGHDGRRTLRFCTRLSFRSSGTSFHIMVRHSLLTQFRTAGIAQRERAVAHEAGAPPPAELSSRAHARCSAARPLPRRSAAAGYGRRLRRPAAPVAGVHRCGTASGATPTTACPPPPARRGGRPQSAARSGLAVAAVRREPHQTASPGRRPTAPATPSTAPAGTRSHLLPHNAHRRRHGAGRHRLAAAGWKLRPPAARHATTPPTRTVRAPRRDPNKANSTQGGATATHRWPTADG